MGKILVLYNDKHYVYDTIEECAVSLLGMEIVKTSTDGWAVILNAISPKGVAFYTSEWTKEEVKRDFLGGFPYKFTYKNLQFFKQIKNE